MEKDGIIRLVLELMESEHSRAVSSSYTDKNSLLLQSVSEGGRRLIGFSSCRVWHVRITNETLGGKRVVTWIRNGSVDLVLVYKLKT